MSAAAPRVGFLGLGIMGAQMASRLVGTGQNVMVYNRSVAKAEPLRQLGAAVASTPAEVTSTCDLVFAMLADPKAAKAVAMDGPDSAVAGIAARPASAQPVTYVDCSTVDAASPAAPVARPATPVVGAPVGKTDTACGACRQNWHPLRRL